MSSFDKASEFGMSDNIRQSIIKDISPILALLGNVYACIDFLLIMEPNVHECHHYFGCLWLWVGGGGVKAVLLLCKRSKAGSVYVSALFFPFVCTLPFSHFKTKF